jgi:LysR family nitrogen assimilation transcriptional regulator
MAGTVFRDRVRNILRELDRARIEVQGLSRSPGGRIDLGMPLSISQALTRVLLDRVREELPQVSLRIMDGWTGFIIEWLLLGRLDLGVIYDHTLSSDRLRTEPLALEHQFLVCAPDDRLGRRPGPIPLSKLAGLPLALPGREHGLRVAVEQSLRVVGRMPQVRVELESVVGLKQLVQQGGIYSVLPRGEMNEELSAGRLVSVPISPPIARTLFIAWSNERPIAARTEALLEMIRRETARLIGAGIWGTTFLGQIEARHSASPSIRA